MNFDEQDRHLSPRWHGLLARAWTGWKPALPFFGQQVHYRFRSSNLIRRDSQEGGIRNYPSLAMENLTAP
jgi:hypothetical protein